MAENLEAYFKSENDAEAASAKIKTLNTSNVLVEEVPGDMDEKLFVPFHSSGDMATSTVSGVTPIAPEPMEKEEDRGASEKLTHMLHFQVDEKDYEQAVEILKKSGSYIDKSSFS